MLLHLLQVDVQGMGLGISFNPSPTVTSGSGSSTMTITLPTNIAAGTYPITITRKLAEQQYIPRQ